MQYSKANPHTLEVRKTVPEKVIPVQVEAVQYDMTFLKQEKIRADAALIAAQAEVTRIDTLLAQALLLGIVEEV